ncbi:YicC/YloC family endoribonuclease [Mesosutterella sp. AGMB02718]|uniref:YicC/YloC family endoribonuclease n=1 Tax=Mesosutterella faecium TaxID=2925194 RepID=A0ABT7IMM5_9BURK|nr:YicC/YloC family endoribonuclease [Mesosutterella sp. AGMB02718]MDL2059161.1 YicC/YloC family endoribonuclease [Mesosutterella sp. AGMB02718]
MAAVSSMTGYATVQAPSPAGLLTIELRSVNFRFLDLALKLPDELRQLEGPIREAIGARVHRGKMECRISLKNSEAADSVRLNSIAAARLRALQDSVLESFPEAEKLSVSQILNYPGVLAVPEINAEQLSQDVLSAVGSALESFTASRVREGAALAKVLLGYCDTVEKITRSIAARVPDILKNMNDKLEERMQEALGRSLSEASSLTKEEVNERIKSELTLYALRMDVAEEINRLITHTNEVRRVLSAGGPVGRRLDFLMQELNREANTLGSKAVAIEMTNASLDLKTTIEKMREQIQNLE